jgi:hypothetical protein
MTPQPAQPVRRPLIGKRMFRAPLCLAWLPLFVCSCAHVRESRVQELQPVMAAASCVPSGPDDFSFIDPVARGKKIVFIGEIPHGVPEIHAMVLDLSLHLRKELGYSVLACERLYSCWPYMEAQSLGHDAPLPNALPQSERIGDPNQWLGPVAAYNRGAHADPPLLCTALDLDHAISHTKPQTVLYLGYVASKSTSGKLRAELAKRIPALLNLKGRKEIHAYLDDLERQFHTGWDSFSAVDQEEITFSLALEHASIEFHRFGLKGTPGSRLFKLRAEYFCRTIERALAKAESSGGPLICYVGSGHAWLNQHGWEAAYFDKTYPATRGQVGSILVEKLSRCMSFDLQKDFRPSALEKAALARMGDRDRIFVNLRDESWASVKHRPRKFFPRNGPDYDGVLFIK